MSTYTAQHKASLAAKVPPTRVKRTVAKPVDAPQPTATLEQDLNSLFTKHNIVVPESSRFFISLIASAIAGGVIGYVASIVLVYTITGTMILTGSLLVAFMVEVLGFFLMAMACWKAGTFIQSYIMSDSFDRSYQKCSNTVRGFFTRRNEVTS